MDIVVTASQKRCKYRCHLKSLKKYLKYYPGTSERPTFLSDRTKSFRIDTFVGREPEIGHPGGDFLCQRYRCPKKRSLHAIAYRILINPARLRLVSVMANSFVVKPTRRIRNPFNFSFSVFNFYY